MKKLFLIAALICSSLSAKIDQNKVLDYDNWLRTLGDVINIFEARYYKDIDIEKTMSNAIKGFAEQDPHTVFLDKKSCKDLQEKMSGEFYGIGVVLPGDKKKEEDFIAIIEVAPGGPSDKAGIKSGDKLIQVNDEVVKGFDIDELMTKLRGEKNTQVVLKVLREKYPEPLSFEIKRDIIKDEMALSYYFKELDVYYLLLAIFSEKSTANVKKVLERAIKEKSRGVIIDLRNNTGGLFDSAIDISGLFLPKGTPLVSIKERNDKISGSWKTKRTPLNLPSTMPIFFIVNNYTASASEILTGALQIYAEKNNLPIFIVGVETFGKGSVQEVIPINNSSALKVTTGLYYLPFDTCIQGKGVTPDFVLDFRTPPTETMKWMTNTYGKETSLRGSIRPQGHEEHKKKKEAEQKSKEEAKKDWKKKRLIAISQDYYIQNTLMLMNFFHLGSSCYPKQLDTQKKRLEYLRKQFTLDAPLDPEEVKL